MKNRNLVASITMALSVAAQAVVSKLMDAATVDLTGTHYAPSLPRRHKRGSAAADKRMARKRNNIRKHPRGVA